MHISRLRALLIALVVVFTGTAGFGLGRRSAFDAIREPVRIVDHSIFLQAAAGSAVARGGSSERAGTPASGVSGEESEVVGSRSGSKYHYPWCSGAQRIKEENRVVFANIEAARAAGYTPAANCEGLK